MTSKEQVRLSEEWRAAFDAANELWLRVVRLEQDRETTVASVRAALAGRTDNPWDSHRAFLVLACLDWEFSAELLPELVHRANGERWAELARRAIGGIEREVLQRHLPEEVYRLVAQDESTTYQFMLHLLDYLGFKDQLEVVRARAERSDDPDNRELGVNWAT